MCVEAFMWLSRPSTASVGEFCLFAVFILSSFERTSIQRVSKFESLRACVLRTLNGQVGLPDPQQQAYERIRLLHQRQASKRRDFPLYPNAARFP